MVGIEYSSIRWVWSDNLYSLLFIGDEDFVVTISNAHSPSLYLLRILVQNGSWSGRVGFCQHRPVLCWCVVALIVLWWYRVRPPRRIGRRKNQMHLGFCSDRAQLWRVTHEILVFHPCRHVECFHHLSSILTVYPPEYWSFSFCIWFQS